MEKEKRKARRAPLRDETLDSPKSSRPFAFAYEHHAGFSRSFYVRLWKLNLTWSGYQGNWYVALMWS